VQSTGGQKVVAVLMRRFLRKTCRTLVVEQVLGLRRFRSLVEASGLSVFLRAWALVWVCKMQVLQRLASVGLQGWIYGCAI